MKKVLIVLISVYSLFFVSCNLMSNGFNASMKDFFDENLGTARITGCVPLQTYYTGNDGYLNIPSDSDFEIKLSLHNPQGYKFELGKNLTIRMKDETVNKEPNITGEPDNLKFLYNIYSDPNDKTNSTLILYFEKSFLKKWESGGDISPIITLSHPLSDETFGSYDKLKLRSNSPPPPVSDIEIFKYFNGNDQCYCIAFTMPAIEEIHKDISKIEIKIGSEGETVDKIWNVKIEKDGTFSFEGERQDSFEYGGAGYEDVERAVTYYSDVNFSSHSEIVCYITLYDKWLKTEESKKVEASKVSEYPDSEPIVIDEEKKFTEDITEEHFEFDGKKLILDGVSAGNIEMTKEGASLVLTGEVSVSEVTLGAKDQSIVLEEDFELKEGSDPIKISLDESYEEGDEILVPEEGKELTEEDIKNFEIDSDEYEIELKDGKGVIKRKPEQPGEENPPVEEPEPPVEIKPSFELTLPVNEEYEFTVKINNVKVSGEKIEVERGGNISFDVKTKDGETVSNGAFEISLKQNGDIFVPGVGKKIDIDEEIPLGNYEIYMSAEIDGTKLDKTLPVEVVKNGGRA